MIALTAFWWALAALLFVHGVWWRLLAVIAVRRPRISTDYERSWRFTVIVPAHNEAASVGRCVESLRAAQFATEPEVLVVADNCGDETASVAARAGASVLVRNDAQRCGKSYALDFAMEHLATRETPPDAVIIVDADSVVSERFFAAIASRLEAGARAVQVHYEPDPGDLSGLARLRRVQFALIHWARPLGASRLRLGVGLKGNGMALTWDVAREGLGGVGTADDAAMTLALARRGIAVRFEPGASVMGDVSLTYDNARIQDERWERGRFQLLRSAMATAVAALARGRVAPAAAAVEVASLPLSLLALSTGVVLAMATLGVGSIFVALAIVEMLAEYVLVGFYAARGSWRDLFALRHVPAYLAHKLAIYGRVLTRPGQMEWRTTREGRDQP